MAYCVVQTIPVVAFQFFLMICGHRVSTQGRPLTKGQPTLILSNHVSWMDIPVIGSLYPVSFVSKEDIAGWLGIGFFARLSRTIFLDRNRKTDIKKVNKIIADRLNDKEAIVFFPEGTTGDGVHFLPFRSSVLGAARLAIASSQQDHIMLQPLCIRYVKWNGCPVTRQDMPEIAWYGHMDLISHVRRFLENGPWDIEVIWGEPVPFYAESDRKQITLQIEKIIRSSFQKAPETR